MNDLLQPIATRIGQLNSFLISKDNYKGLINYSREKSNGYRYNTDYKTDNLFLNFTHGVDADNATGNLVLEPNDVWWGRFAGTVDTADITAEAAANDIKVLIYAVLDDVA